MPVVPPGGFTEEQSHCALSPVENVGRVYPQQETTRAGGFLGGMDPWGAVICFFWSAVLVWSEHLICCKVQL